MQNEMHKAVIQGDATMAMGLIKRDNVQVTSSIAHKFWIQVRAAAYFAEAELQIASVHFVQIPNSHLKMIKTRHVLLIFEP